jgi:hypothetical protein
MVFWLTRGGTVGAITPVAFVTLLKTDRLRESIDSSISTPQYMPVAGSPELSRTHHGQPPENMTTMRERCVLMPTVEIASQISRELPKTKANTKSRRCRRDGRVAAPHHR